MVLGILAAFVFVQSRLMEVSLFPYAIILQVTPIVAIAPLIIIWVKDPIPAMVICATMVALFPIISNTILGPRSVNPGLLNLFRLNRATRWQTLTRLRVPNALRGRGRSRRQRGHRRADRALGLRRRREPARLRRRRTLEVGQAADLAVYRLDEPRYLGLNDRAIAPVVSGGRPHLKWLLVDGEIRVEDDTIAGLDMAELRAQARVAVGRLSSRRQRRP